MGNATGVFANMSNPEVCCANCKKWVGGTCIWLRKETTPDTKCSEMFERKDQ